MPAPAIASLGASVIGGVLQGSAQKKAAKAATAASTAATNAALAETKRQYDNATQLLTPYISSGTSALSSQMALLGLGGGMQGGTPLGITTIAGQSGQTPIYGTQTMNVGSDRHQVTQKIITGYSQSTGQPMYQTSDGQTFKTMEEAQAYANANKTGGTMVSAKKAQQDAINGIVNGSQFTGLVKQGEDAILANASATGGLRGGDTQGALAQFRPQMLQSLIDKQLANLSGVAGVGANAAGSLASGALQTGQNNANLITQNGNTQAQAAISRGDSTSGTISGITGAFGDTMGLKKPVWTGAAKDMPATGYAKTGTLGTKFGFF